MTFPPAPIPVATPSIHAVWRQYRRGADARARDRLLFTLAPLVRHAGARTDDDAARGLAALLAAVEEYAPDRHGGLEHHAWVCVRRALTSSA